MSIVCSEKRVAAVCDTTNKEVFDPDFKLKFRTQFLRKPKSCQSVASGTVVVSTENDYDQEHGGIAPIRAFPCQWRVKPGILTTDSACRDGAL